MSSSMPLHRYDSTVSRSLAFLDQLFPQPRNYVIQLGDQIELPAAAAPTFRLVFKNIQGIKKLFSPPIELSLGEGYIHGDFDILGDIYTALGIVDTLAGQVQSLKKTLRLLGDYLSLPTQVVEKLSGRGPIELDGRVHTLERDRKAIQYHYDVGNNFYAIWLDRNMQYSCGYFPTGTEDLDTAQVRKMEHICRKLRLQPGETLLDIGCGWGGLIRYAAQNYGIKSLGVTLSQNQAEYAQQKIIEQGLEGQARVELCDYRSLSSASFDKIVSVGMYEHVGRSHLPEYFSHVYRLLKPGGLFLNHGIALREKAPKIVEDEVDGQPILRQVKSPIWSRWLEKSLLGVGSFSQKYIFPDGELELVSDANLFGEMAGFEVRDVENLREHYALTIRNWVKNLDTHRNEVEQVTDPVTYRTWRLYLASAVHGFESGSISVNQTLFSKPDNGKSYLPLSREDLYQPLRL
jgi:cyclopropane-fatty-acyl-phospholipid synthase